MALPDYSYLVAGTPKVWKNTAGDYVLTLTSLADQAARQGDKGDFNDGTLGLPEVLDIMLETAVAATAANGTVIEMFAGQSDNATAGTNNPSILTGADGSLATPTEYKLQLDFVGSLNLSNARSTNNQKQKFRFFPTCRYWIPVIFNRAGQALHGTAGNHILTVTPYYRRIAD